MVVRGIVTNCLYGLTLKGGYRSARHKGVELDMASNARVWFNTVEKQSF